MTVTAFDEALSKLRQQARRQRMLRYKGAVKPMANTSAQKRAYEPAEPPARMIVGDWYTDDLGNQTRIIWRAP